MLKEIVFASLLHDIGKLLQRADGLQKDHSTTGNEYLKRCNNENLNTDEILKAIRYHHAKDLVSSKLDNNHIAYIVYEADNISSAHDRRENLEKEIEEEQKKWANYQKDICLSSVFNKINNNTEYSYLLRDLEDVAPNMPINCSQDDIRATQNKYKDLKLWIDRNIDQIKNPNSLLELLEAVMSFVPSSTDKSQVADISLYDHSKLTAAIASCMYEYFKENNITDYKEKCFNQNKMDDYRKENYYRLVTFDLSGIQNFIYTIATKDALKSLRARSFYLEFIMEHIQDELLDELNLSRANILYSGGGHSYLLLPNTQITNKVLEELQIKMNSWFLKHFSIDLYLAYASTECSSNDLKSTNVIFKENSKQLSKAKLQRYNSEQLKMIFDVENQKRNLDQIEKECRICKTSSKDTDENDICDLCNSLIELGRRLVEDKELSIIVVDNKDALNDDKKYFIELPSLLKENKYFKVLANSAKNKKELSENYRIYSINNFSKGEYYSTNIWMGDYCYKEDNKNVDFETFAESSNGIKKLGVLRADVDNLGTIFTNGFGKNYSTISRYATLSRTLNLFYKHYINDLCKNLKIAIVYSGGDDVFAVGAWNDVLKFAKLLKEKFTEYTCSKLTLSAGVGFFTHSYPVYKMAELTGELEEFAKKNKNNTKNSIALFGENKTVKDEKKIKTEQFVFTWEEFDKILNLKEEFENICYFNEDAKENGKIFFSTGLIYRIMILINSENKISLARFAYTLARLEPKKNDDILMSNYIKLKNKLYDLYNNDSKKLLTTLYLIVYENRK